MAAIFAYAILLTGFLDVGFAVIDPNHLGYNDTNTMKNPFMTNVTGTTPPPLVCFNFMCNGKSDGNYEVKFSDGQIVPNYFLQCANGQASCQPCWPLSLEFSPECNQCLYKKDDECVTTKPWQPATTFNCPDICMYKGVDFSGNMADPDQPRQYIACWKGMTVGCIACNSGLLFNETANACLYEGKYWTQMIGK